MGGPVQLSRRDCRIAPGLRSSCNPTVLQPMGQIELRLDCKTGMHRKDCTKILGNPHSKSGSGRHPGNPHRNHDSTPQSQCNPVTIKLNCNKIAKPRRIASGSKGLQKNPGKSTNCKQLSPIAPELASHRNAGTIFCNLDDCGGIADSRQSHHNPVSTRPNPSTGHLRIAIE